MDRTIDFYLNLGFSLYNRYGNEYAILRWDSAEIHFFGYPDIDPATSVFTVYLRTPDADALHRSFVSKGVTILAAPEDKPWKQREMALVDPDGTLLRIGQALAR